MAIIPGTMYDDSGDWALMGTAEDNVIWGGAGDDELMGGDGTDTASYAGSMDAVAASLMTGMGTMGDAMGDTFSWAAAGWIPSRAGRATTRLTGATATTF